MCVHCLAQRRWSYRRVGIHPGNTLREQKELHMSYFYYASPTPTLFRPSGAIPTVCGQTNNLCTYQQFVDIPTVCGHTNNLWTYQQFVDIPTVCGHANSWWTNQQFVDIPTVCGHPTLFRPTGQKTTVWTPTLFRLVSLTLGLVWYNCRSGWPNCWSGWPNCWSGWPTCWSGWPSGWSGLPSGWSGWPNCWSSWLNCWSRCSARIL